MTVIAMPGVGAGAPHFTDTRFGLISNTQNDLTTPLTQTSQFLELPGARFKAVYKLPPMTRAQAAAWQAFGLRLRGRSGEFYGYDPDAAVPRGSAAAKSHGDLKIVNAGSPGLSGRWLVADGADPLEQNVFLQGDYVAYDVGAGRQLHMVVAAASADSAGELSLEIEPPIRTTPADNEDLLFLPASCVMRLVDDEFGWDASRISRYGITFEAVEVF